MLFLQKKHGDGNGEAPIKICDNCHEIVHASAKICPACQEPFPINEKDLLKLHDVDIMGIRGTDLIVKDWKWAKHVSKASEKEMLKITYYGSLSDTPVVEYLPVTHDGYAGQKARTLLAILANKAHGHVMKDLAETALIMNESIPPKEIEYKKDGKYYRVIDRRW